jgi:sugar phosphate permease
LTALEYRPDQGYDRTRASARFSLIVPLAFITYGLAFLDRVNYGYGESRLRETLHLDKSFAPVLAGLFFLGYFIFQIPGAVYASRRSVKPLVFWAMILWGILSSLTGLLRSPALLALDRVLLGCVEGVVLPAMLIFLTRWFTKPERSRANALLILANPVTMAGASVLCGFVINHFEHHPFKVGGTALAGWQMMFIVEGLPSLLWAGLWMWLADERPAEARWMKPEEAAAVQEKLDAEQRAMPQVHNYLAAFADPRVVLLSLMYLCFSAASYGLTMWLPQIVEAATPPGPRRVTIAGLLTSVPYLVAIFSMLAVSYVSDRTLRRKPCVWGSMFVGCAAFCAASLAGKDHPWLAYAALIVVGSCLYTPCGPLWAWMADMLPRNVVGESMALVNSAGALGGFLGITIAGWIKNRGGGSSVSTVSTFIFLAACFAAAGLLSLSVRTRAVGEGSGFPVLQPAASGR